jgi:predicted PurR-regulated permease PerM
MERIFRIVVTAFIVGVIIFLAWRFSDILTYILISVVLSLIGRPLVKAFDRIKIGNWHFPHMLSSFLALLIMVMVLAGLVRVFVPLIAQQAEMINSIDVQAVSRSLEEPVSEIQDFMIKYNILKEKESIETLLVTNIESVVSFATFSDIFKDILSFAGNLFIGVFAVLFITFFFLKEENLFFNGTLLLLPMRYQEEGKKILLDSQHLLSRYFVGLLIELSTMVALISSGLTIFGVENAFIIGLLGGVMNVIPYIGPIIGTTIGLILGTITHLSVGEYSDLFTLLLTIMGTFAVSNLIDNIILQPWIYSSSVKAHPLEIFLVIMIAGSMAGVVGMVLAIPSYTVLRIIAKQFLSQSRVIQTITKDI